MAAQHARKKVRNKFGQLKFQSIKHLFMVDYNRHCRTFLAKNFAIDAQNLHSDVYDLDVHALPVVALFLFSPSCKSYSNNGKTEGEAHKEGEVAWVAMAYLDIHRPLMFAFEQVKEFMNYDIWRKILQVLLSFQCYEFRHALLGGATHGGVPQTRVRLFGWGIQRLVSTGLVVPAPLAWHLRLEDLLDLDDVGSADDLPADSVGLPNLIDALKKTMSLDPLNKLLVFDLYGTKCSVYCKGVFPTITAARAGGRGYFLSSLLRFSKLHELVRLMDMPPHKLDWEGVSPRQQGMMLGNSIVVPVGSRVLQSLLLKALVAQSLDAQSIKDQL